MNWNNVNNNNYNSLFFSSPKLLLSLSIHLKMMKRQALFKSNCCTCDLLILLNYRDSSIDIVKSLVLRN